MIDPKHSEDLVVAKAPENSNLASAHDLELKVAKFLRYGVILAGLLLGVGWLLDIDFNGNPFVHFKHYAPVPLVDGVYQAWLDRGWGLLFAYCGLIVLIALPVIRVAMTAIVFLKQRDFRMMGIAIFVWLSLLASLMLSSTAPLKWP